MRQEDKTERILDFIVNLCREMLQAGANLERISISIKRICKCYHLSIALILDFLGLYDRFFTSVLWAVMGVIFTLIGVSFIIMVLWIYPLLAHFHNSTILMARNSLLLGFKYLPLSIVMALVYVGMGFLILKVSSAFLFLGMGSCTLLNTIFINRILICLEEKE